MLEINTESIEINVSHNFYQARPYLLTVFLRKVLSVDNFVCYISIFWGFVKIDKDILYKSVYLSQGEF